MIFIVYTIDINKRGDQDNDKEGTRNDQSRADEGSKTEHQHRENDQSLNEEHDINRAGKGNQSISK